jgi:electron transfer flavoprotein alpha/beta subunit
LRLIGCELVEMPRNRDNSFCCGAGGGRIWIPDTPGQEKPSENRIREAAGLGAIDSFITCCPKDLTMFEDARKTSGHEKDFVVEDLAELVAEAIQLEGLSLAEMPSLAERITDAVAGRIANVVAERLDQVLTQRLATLPAVPQPQALAPSAAPQELPSPEAALAALEETQPEAPAEAIAEAAEPAADVTDSGAPQLPLQEMTWENLAPVQPPALDGYDVPAKEGLRILVTVKHAAVLGDEYDFTADGRDISADYLEYQLNEWDDAALEEALLATEKLGGGEVVAVCIGPEEAEVSLRKVLAKGAHRAVRVWDPALAGADPVTVARAIAGIAKLEQPDLILSGVQSSDHAHGATGTALARILGLPHAAVVVGMDWDGKDKLQIIRELEGGVRHSFELPSPALLTIQTGINAPRYATMRMIKQAKKKPLAVVDGAAAADAACGYRIRRIYTPEQSRAEMLEGGIEDIAKFVAGVIRDQKGS